MTSGWPEPFTIDHPGTLPGAAPDDPAATRRFTEFGFTVNRRLAALGERVWAARTDGGPIEDVTEHLTLGRLCLISGVTVQTWHRVHVRWEPPLLHVDLGPARFTLQVLTPVQEQAYEAWRFGTHWADRDCTEPVASRIVDVTDPVLKVTELIQQAIESTGDDISYGDVLHAVQAAGITTVTAEDLEIIAGLADGWTESLEELITTPEHVQRTAART
jgi:hypothetical protein